VTVPNLANTVISGRTKGGYRSAIYRDAKGRTWKCEVLSGPAGGPFTIRIPASLHLPAAQHTLSGIALGTAKNQTNCVFASARMS
jgi:hypothetical protein